jgi:hypothetical protein
LSSQHTSRAVPVLRQARRWVAAIFAMAALVAVGFLWNHPSANASAPRMPGHTSSVTVASSIKQLTALDEKARGICGAWAAASGGGPVGAPLVAALDSTVRATSEVMMANSRSVLHDPNLSQLKPSDYVAVCVFDVDKVAGFTGSTRLAVYATPQNDGVGLITAW